MKVNKKITQLLFAVMILFFYACGPRHITYKYEFSARTDPFKKHTLNISKKYLYSFSLGNNEDELIEKNILSHIGKYLDSIGWEYVKDMITAEVLVSIKYSIIESDKKYTKVVKTGSHQVVATNLDGSAKKDKEGNVKYKNKNIYGTEERTREGYLKEYNINVSHNGIPVWSADISSFDKRHDLVRVSKRLIPKILKQNFLKNSSKSGKYTFYIGCTDKNASNYCKKCEISDLSECKY